MQNLCCRLHIGGNDYMVNTIGGVLRRIRFDSKLSQRQMADKLGFSAISIHSYEHDKRKPGIAFYKALIAFSPIDEAEILATVDLPIGLLNPEAIESDIVESLRETISLQKDIIKLLKEKIKGTL